jgi:hypothetical protein
VEGLTVASKINGLTPLEFIWQNSTNLDPRSELAS